MQETDDADAPRDLLYRGLFQHAHLEVHIWRVVRDPAGEIVTWRLIDANPATLVSWDREREDVIGRTTNEIFRGVDPVSTFLPIVREIMESGAPKEWEVEFAGTDQILQMVSFPVGEYFVSTGFDVSLPRRQSRELAQALQQLKQAIRASGVGLWDWDLQTDVVRFSDEWKAQLGFGPDDFEDHFREWEVRVHPDDLQETLATVQRSIDTANQAHEGMFRMRHRDGSYRWILAQGSIESDETGQPRRMLGSHIDITERRRLEERVLESQKLESLGTLAAGIAHDFNNLLTAITGNLSLIRSMPVTEEEGRELLQDVEEAAGRAQALTAQLLTFAKGGAPVREIASIREVIVQTANFVTRGASVRCAFAVAEDLSNVEADVGQISQVIENLVLNARQAMQDAGIIRIEATNIILGDGDAAGLAAGRWVKVSVIDQGMGIAPEHLTRVFDPFFTTKAQGSGLGLTSSYAIVAKHGGRLTVTSQVGRGSVFDVYLPASDGETAAQHHQPLESGKGHILVMDDQTAVRNLVSRVLIRLGYTCDAAADGDEALGAFDRARQAGHPHDVVILDLTIPGKAGGLEVLGRLRELDPDVVAIVVSGYTDDDVLVNPHQHGFRGRIRKPMGVETLGAEVARVLRESRA